MRLSCFNRNIQDFGIKVELEGEYASLDEEDLTKFIGGIKNLTIKKENSLDEPFLQLRDIAAAGFLFDFDEIKIVFYKVNEGKVYIYCLNGDGVCDMTEDNINLCTRMMRRISPGFEKDLFKSEDKRLIFPLTN